jgi:hypothetical protein
MFREARAADYKIFDVLGEIGLRDERCGTLLRRERCVAKLGGVPRWQLARLRDVALVACTETKIVHQAVHRSIRSPDPLLIR